MNIHLSIYCRTVDQILILIPAIPLNHLDVSNPSSYLFTNASSSTAKYSVLSQCNLSSQLDAVLLSSASLLTTILTPFFTLFWRIFIGVLLVVMCGALWSTLTVVSGEKAHYSGVRPYFFVMFASDFYILLFCGLNEWLERGFFVHMDFPGLENLNTASCKIFRHVPNYLCCIFSSHCKKASYACKRPFFLKWIIADP